MQHYNYAEIQVQAAITNSLFYMGYVEITQLSHVLLNSGLDDVDQDNLILMIYKNSPKEKIAWRRNEKQRVSALIMSQYDQDQTAA